MEAEESTNSPPCDSYAGLEAILIDLERQWQERTSDLQAVRTSIHQTNMVNSEMLANMGHELAKPLNDVIGLARLMLESELDCHQKTATETIIQSCHALLQTLDDIVDLSGAGEGHAENPEPLLANAGTITALVDRDYVNKMKSDFQNGMYGNLLEQYCSDSEQTLRNLELAVERQDTSQVKNLLHLLKGCSANFGASAIVKLCEGHTRRFGQSNNMTRPEFAQLKQTYENTRSQLQQADTSGS